MADLLASSEVLEGHLSPEDAAEVAGGNLARIMKVA